MTPVVARWGTKQGGSLKDEKNPVREDGDGWPFDFKNVYSDDANENVNPAVTEVTDNGIDDDCDGSYEDFGGVDCSDEAFEFDLTEDGPDDWPLLQLHRAQTAAMLRHQQMHHLPPCFTRRPTNRGT